MGREPERREAQALATVPFDLRAERVIGVAFHGQANGERLFHLLAEECGACALLFTIDDELKGGHGTLTSLPYEWTKEPMEFRLVLPAASIGPFPSPSGNGGANATSRWRGPGQRRRASPRVAQERSI